MGYPGPAGQTSASAFAARGRPIRSLPLAPSGSSPAVSSTLPSWAALDRQLRAVCPAGAVDQAWGWRAKSAAAVEGNPFGAPLQLVGVGWRPSGRWLSCVFGSLRKGARLTVG